MIVPLEWLSEYVKLPKDVVILTDKLTAIGHMLDKIKEVDGKVVIDLELRGNRSDMFGVWGVAREVSAALETPLKPPQVATLTKKDPNHALVTVEKNAVGLVTRFEAIRLKVKIGPSPKWLVEHLATMDIPTINNVVDITNYVMMETAEPMHAFDYHKLEGGRLILRRAKKGEKFSTIQQGLEVTLSEEDLVICDTKAPQTLTAIGGLHSKVTDQTTEIILEAAVYDPANARRSSRRLKIFTNGSVRHEKHLDPNQVEFALQRAVYLLKELADAEIVGEVSDYYPNPVQATIIDFDLAEVNRLTGTTVTPNEAETILTALEFKIKPSGKKWKVTVPTFRTDIEESADIVEEIIRMYGYDRIPSTPITDAIPVPQTYTTYAIQEKLRDHMLSMGFDEIVTLSMVPNAWAPEGIEMVNPPDPDQAKLRTSLLPSLAHYARRLVNFNTDRVAIFEVGKVFTKAGNKYRENIKLGIAVAGLTANRQWNSQPVKIDESYLAGVLQTLFKLLGVENLEKINYRTDVGIYSAELDCEEIMKLSPKFTNPYKIVSQFAALVEDYNIVLTDMGYGTLEKAIKNISPLVQSVKLIDKHGDKLTVRVTYHSANNQVSGEDVAPLREKFTALGRE